LKKYIGIDIVPSLIEHHNITYGAKEVSFAHKDITSEKLPLAQLYLVRQVFQHLSNNDILNSLKNIPSKSKLNA
jgi:hypothetical protein